MYFCQLTRGCTTQNTNYSLIGVTEKSYLIATVGNSSLGSALGRTVGVESDGLSFPGKAYWFQLVSRELKDE